MNDESRPSDFTGIWVDETVEGTRYEVQYVNGVRHGIWRLWIGDVCHREGSMKDGRWHGPHIIRSSEGKVLDATVFDEGTGIYRIFNSYGRLTDEIPMLRGKRHGMARSWIHGKLVVTQFFNNGVCDAAVYDG